MKKVAILHHHAITRYLTEYSLEPFYNIVSFDSIDALRAECGRYQPDVIVCEICDSGFDARELFPDIAEKHPIVFISTRPQINERRNCLLQAPHRYLSTPFSPEFLRNAVRLILDSFPMQLMEPLPC